MFLFVAVIIAPFTINAQNINSSMHLSAGGWISILFLGVWAGMLLKVFALSEMSASKVGAFLYLEPFVTLFGAWLMLNEHITALMILSGLIIIGGVILVNRK